jgi:hypothetical protein
MRVAIELLPVNPQGEHLGLGHTGDVDVGGEVAFLKQDQDPFADRVGARRNCCSSRSRLVCKVSFRSSESGWKQPDDPLPGVVVQPLPALPILLGTLAVRKGNRTARG